MAFEVSNTAKSFIHVILRCSIYNIKLVILWKECKNFQNDFLYNQFKKFLKYINGLHCIAEQIGKANSLISPFDNHQQQLNVSDNT